MHHSFLRAAAALALAAAATPALADPRGVYLPPAPTGPGGDDSIETSSGTRCRQSINSNGAYLDVGTVASARRTADGGRSVLYDDPGGSEATTYARITIPLGHRPKRIDCTRVYEMELARLRQEVDMLKMGLNIGK